MPGSICSVASHNMGEGAVAPGTTAEALGATAPLLMPLSSPSSWSTQTVHGSFCWCSVYATVCTGIDIWQTHDEATLFVCETLVTVRRKTTRHHHSAAQASTVYLSNNPTVRTSASIQLTARSDKNTNSCYKSTRTLTLENCTVSNKWTWFLRINNVVFANKQ